MNELKYFSTFTGAGGFEIVIERAFNNRGLLQCVGFSEIDKYASQVIRYIYPNTKNYGDISKINWNEVPDFDMLVGGSPCQDLSIAGKRKGLEGARSGLFYEYMRAVREKKPQYFIWENVKGALSSNNGWDFAAVLNEMAEAGYSLQWQICNAKDFGVPQNRERIFVIGTRGDSQREVFFERGCGEVNNGENGQGNAYCLNAGGDKHRGTYINQLNNPTHSNDRVYGEDGLSPALNTMQGGNRQPFVSKPPKIRRLTPTECMRLMAWPDDHCDFGIDEKGNKVEISDSQKYKMAGNGVVSNVVEAIVYALHKSDETI